MSLEWEEPPRSQGKPEGRKNPMTPKERWETLLGAYKKAVRTTLDDEKLPAEDLRSWTSDA